MAGLTGSASMTIACFFLLFLQPCRRTEERRGMRRFQNFEREQQLRHELFAFMHWQGAHGSNQSDTSNADSDNPQSSDSSDVDIAVGDISGSDSEQGNGEPDGDNENNDRRSGSDSEKGMGELDGDDKNNGSRNGSSSDSSESNSGEQSDSTADQVEELTNDEKEAYLIESLREWALRPGVLSHRKLDELLTRLHHVFKSVPLSYKSLLGVPSDLDV